MRSWDQLTAVEQDASQRELQIYVENGDLAAVAARTVSGNADIDWVNPDTGLPLLHYAVGRNQVEIVRHLLEHGAKVTPDRYGRWPSILALELECDDAISDMVEHAESAIVASGEVVNNSETVAPPAADVVMMPYDSPGAKAARRQALIEKKLNESPEDRLEREKQVANNLRKVFASISRERLSFKAIWRLARKKAD